jgi:hypothetical protein
MTEIRIDDLREPRYSDAQQGALDYERTMRVVFDENELLDAARERTGLHNFGDDGFRARLRAMIDAVDDDSGLNQLGRLTIHQRALRLLQSRLLLEDLYRRHPEIDDVALEPPIIVVGLPRSGTTHLVNLVAADQRLRSLPYWESIEPFPLPGEPPGARWERCRSSYELQMQMAPLLQAMHHQHPDAIEEEIELEDLDFASYTLEWYARVPRWRDYYLSLDQRPHYAYLRRVLKALTFLRGPNRWVLKSPQHLEQLGPLVETFPDAAFAVTHRDPISVISSAVTMLAYGDRMRRYAIEPEALAEYWVDRIERLLRACVRDRDLLPADRTVDVLFHEFMADDVAMVEQIYARAGLPMTVDAREQLDAFMAANERGKYGRIVYDPHGDFGLDIDAVRQRFAFYYDRFPVEIEAVA